MNQKNMSILDAFLALEDLEDEEIKMPLKEGKGFNVRDEKDMDKAEEFVNQDNKKEVALEVIDVDADSLEHLKNNEEYVGQIILQCNSCKANKFINAEDLVQSEGDDDVYNIEDECPHCHGKGNGFHLIGQVGKVETEQEEPKFNNDSLTDEPKFDNDQPEEAPVEEAPAEKAPAEEEQANEPFNFKEVEDNGMETNAEDDTADMKSTLGDEFDSNDVEWDDTEEAPEAPAEEDSLTNDEEDNYEEPLSHIEEPEDEEKKKDKNEELEEDIDTSDQTVYDFFEYIVEPENIENVLIFDLDEDNEEEEIYNGSYEDLPQQLNDAQYVSFDVAQGNLIVNIDSESEIDELTPTVKNILDKFSDEFNDKISVWDQATGEEIFQGTKQSVIEEFGHNAFLSLEAPERLQLKVRSAILTDSLKTPYKEDLNLARDDERLISNIIKENNLREYRVNKFGSEEYWIADSIKLREDLKHIYENYVVNKSSNLINEFKDVTGYKDNLDVLYEETLNESSEDNEEEALNKAKEKFSNPEVTAVIYGYESRGKFHTLQDDVMEIRNDRELRLATELVRAKYHPTGSVKVFYRDGLEPETKESFEADFRNRKDLSEAILKCEAEGINYKIKKSVKEGYRYTLLKESPLGFFNAPAPVEQPAQEQPAAVIDPRDAELVDKLTRIAHNIAASIQNNYGVECDERAILADMIQDLQLVSGQITPEQLADTPLNQLTREMYAAYNGFYEALDELVSFETGQQITTTQAQKIQQALDSLDDERFSPEGIEQGVRDENFLLALQHAQVPGVAYQGNPQEIHLLAAPQNEAIEEKQNKSVGSVLNDYQEEWGYELNPNGMRNAVLKCLEKHKDELNEEAYKYAVMQFTNCRPAGVFGMVAAFTSGMAMTPNNQHKQNQKDLQSESLNEDVKSFEDEAHDEVVKKVFEPRGIKELDWSIEAQKDDEGYQWLNIVHFLTKEDWEKLYKEGDSIKAGLKDSFGSFTTEYAPFFELDRGLPIFDRDAICFYSEAPDLEESLNEAQTEEGLPIIKYELTFDDGSKEVAQIIGYKTYDDDYAKRYLQQEYDKNILSVREIEDESLNEEKDTGTVSSLGLKVGDKIEIVEFSDYGRYGNYASKKLIRWIKEIIDDNTIVVNNKETLNGPFTKTIKLKSYNILKVTKLTNESVDEAISRDEFLKNHPQATASAKVEDHLEDCLKEAENRIDTDFFPEGQEFRMDIRDIFTKVLKGKVDFNFDTLKAVSQYLMEKLPGMYDYLDFEVESLPKTLRIKYKLKPTNESLDEALNGFTKQFYQDYLDKGYKFIFKDSEDEYGPVDDLTTCLECQEGMVEYKRKFDEIYKKVDDFKKVVTIYTATTTDNLMCSLNNKTDKPLNEDENKLNDDSVKEEDDTIDFDVLYDNIINNEKFNEMDVQGITVLYHESENETREWVEEMLKQFPNYFQEGDIIVADSENEDAAGWFFINGARAEYVYDHLYVDGKEIHESLDEAKKDDELPADPEVVKTNVHATLNNLVTDEIEAINGYEEAKAEIADTHIEHKDDIIDTIDHIEDEEQEHIDELINAASEIPFEKEGHEEEPIEEPIQEPEIEQEPEVEPLEDKPFEESYHGDTAEIVNYFHKLEKYLIKNNINHRVENEKRFESIYLDDEKEPSITLGRNDDGSYYIWVGDKLIESPDELLDDEGETYSFYEFLQLAHVKNEETLDFDETKFESFINEWFDKNSEETKVFEAISGNFTDDGTIILEGKLLKEGAEEAVTFTLTPNKEVNEDLMDSKKVTTYTVTSTCLPEGLILKESPILWNFRTKEFETEDEAKKWVEDNFVEESKRSPFKPHIKFNEEKQKWELSYYIWDEKAELEHAFDENK